MLSIRDLDYIMYKNNHLQPNKKEYKIIPLKTNQYNIPITNCTNIYQSLTRNPFTINLPDISEKKIIFYTTLDINKFD